MNIVAVLFAISLFILNSQSNDIVVNKELDNSAMEDNIKISDKSLTKADCTLSENNSLILPESDCGCRSHKPSESPTVLPFSSYLPSVSIYSIPGMEHQRHGIPWTLYVSSS